MHENKVINYEQNGKSYSAYFYVPYADRCVCLINDVTDLKKLKEGTIRALEHENQLLQEKNNQIRLYKTILDQTGIIVFENDLKHSSCYISENVHHYCFKNKIFLPDGTPNPDAVLLKDRVKFMREFSIKYNGHSENQIKTTVRTELIDGSYVWCKFAAKVTFTKQGAPSRITGTIQNVTNEQEYLNTLRRKAEYDTITDIYNKQTFFARTEYLLKHHSPSDFCIIRFDVDNFKMINEFFGHDEGDRLLKHIASKLEKLMLNYNYCNYGHLEADIFAVCMKTSDSKNAISKIEKIADDFDIEFKVTISVGIYNITETNLSPDIMCDRAHLAQKTVKGNFLLHSAYFNQQMHESIINDQMIASMMNQAIEERQFIVYYQPKFNIATNKISGAEALVRWIHPEKGLIYPGSFIPVFEKNGFIMKLDEYVWEDVCIYIRKNLDMGNTVLPISVNISKINLYNPKLCDILIGLVQKYNIPTSLFQLELTESAFTDNKAVMDNIMSKLKAYGFTIMMDDFGSGYSSLSMLKEIPVDVLKIDLRSLFTVKGFSGGDVTALTTVSLGGQTLAALIATILALILEFIGISYPEAVTSFQTSSMAVNIYIYFYVCILGPILEEILYRGVILQGLKQYNKRMAVWISALIFGLMHQNYQQFILGFLIGLALGIITLKSNSLIPSIITHIIVNTSASLLSCSMMAVDNETFQSIASGEYDITSLSPEFILIILLNALIRYGFLFAGIVIFIVFLVKKKNISRPSPAGKSRGWPIIAQSWTWYIILIVYIYLNFIANLQFNK